MAKVGLGAIPDSQPVKRTLTLSTDLAGLLAAYAAAWRAQTGCDIEVAQMIPHMLERFIATGFHTTLPSVR